MLLPHTDQADGIAKAIYVITTKGMTQRTPMILVITSKEVFVVFEKCMR
jgi:hypothetical protein